VPCLLLRVDGTGDRGGRRHPAGNDQDSAAQRPDQATGSQRGGSGGRGRSRGRAEPPMTCMEVRERLTEHAVGVLSKPDAREVERHLEWCAGCRKEASELFDGAASMAFALPMSNPPSSLEGRIVERFRMSTGKAPAPPRGRLWVLAAATLTAALLA